MTSQRRKIGQRLRHSICQELFSELKSLWNLYREKLKQTEDRIFKRAYMVEMSLNKAIDIQVMLNRIRPAGELFRFHLPSKILHNQSFFLVTAARIYNQLRLSNLTQYFYQICPITPCSSSSVTGTFVCSESSNVISYTLRFLVSQFSLGPITSTNVIVSYFP